ncbi:NADH ubiquinone oxidoreductase [Sulfitobacter sp. SK012]|uniref:CIA30 family protein n=1 Tax=Sulfitobacter sp. SK012 TaxID=1389005 RepID=UPI000E0A3AF2|nr:CIA30 family protein [Sulfitobacter sp. SK012]AXI46278.1 NADH ubiquinone oxidoreductase [Sulfitobacter sp. SK012]
MRSALKLAAVVFLLFGAPSPLIAEGNIIGNFERQPETRWRFFADTVMGGVSSGQVTFETDDEAAYAHMTGRVSTANNGGFIQIRTELQDEAPVGTTGVRLIVRGNDQVYFVHLRTSGTVLPWQYYQAGFDVTRNWTEVRLPFAVFEASGRMLRKIPRAQSLRSVGIVAYGRDHDAEIDIREVGFY